MWESLPAWGFLKGEEGGEGEGDLDLLRCGGVMNPLSASAGSLIGFKSCRPFHEGSFLGETRSISNRLSEFVGGPASAPSRV